MYTQISAIVSNWNVQIFQRVLCFDKDLKECLPPNSPFPPKTESKQPCFFALQYTEVSHIASSMLFPSVACMCVLRMCRSFSYLLQVADKIYRQHEGPHQSKLCSFFILMRCIVLPLGEAHCIIFAP